MSNERDLAAVLVKAEQLGEVAPRGARWTHLPLCVLDAVFSIGARYSGTSRTVHRYANQEGLQPATALAQEVAAGRFQNVEQPVTDLLRRVEAKGFDGFAAYVSNRQRTSTRSGVLKSEAVHRYAQVLVRHKVETLPDVPPLLSDLSRLSVVEADLAKVPGHGQFGVRMSYLWMLAGNDQLVKADRMVLRWLRGPLGRTPSVPEAVALVRAAAENLGITPWELDHAIWRAERGSNAAGADRS